MKNLTNFLLGLIFVTLLLILYFQAFTRLRYETQIVGFRDYELPYNLEQLTKNGWQVVGSRRALDQNQVGMYEFILQRKIVNDFFIN